MNVKDHKERLDSRFLNHGMKDYMMNASFAAVEERILLFEMVLKEKKKELILLL